MCQQQQYDMKPHIEVLYENGMPRKLGKSVEKTLQKRAAAAAAAAAAVERNNNIINNNCTNCDECGGCLNPSNDFIKGCVCITLVSATESVLASSSSYSSTSSSEEEEMSNQLVRTTDLQDFTSTDDSDESLEDSDTGFRSSSRKSSRRTCPMAAFLANKTRTLSTSESQSQSAQASSASASVPVPTTHTYQEDILAVFTQLTRKAVIKVNQLSCKVQKSKTFRVLSKSTQPAHVIAVGILSFVLLAVWPNLLENEEAALHANDRRSGWALVAYLGAFSTHFGAQIWMTFVSGLSLYFALPRHTFGLCQQILFPKYFAMNSMLSILTLILFIKVIAGRWEFSSYVQVIALTICAVIEVAVRLYLAPPLLRLMREKHKFEITVGSGQEVGQLEQRDLVKCPHYQGIHKAFRRIHMTVAMGNLTALVCTFLHLHYLASKISVG